MFSDKAHHALVGEVDDLMRLLENALLRLASDAEDQGAIDEIYQAMPILRGFARYFANSSVLNSADVVENVLDRLKSQELLPDSDLIKLLSKCTNHIATLLEIDIAQRESAIDVYGIGRTCL